MTPRQARAHIQRAFKLEWGAVTPVDYGNDMQSVPPAPFVRLAVNIGGRSVADSMNGDEIRYDRAGIAFVQIFTKLGIGTGQADDFAEKVIDILEGREFGWADNDVLSMGAATQRDIGTNENGHWQVNVEIPFTYAQYRTTRSA